MRVLHIDTGREMRGGQHQAILLMSGLRTAGHHNVLLAYQGGPLARTARNEGFEVHSANFANAWRCSRKVDVVHAHDARAHTIAALASASKFVVSRRVAFPPGTSLSSRWKYRRPARFLAASKYVAEQLRAAGVPDSSIDVVYDGVSMNSAASACSGSGEAVALATRDPQKGRWLVEKAAKQAGMVVRFSEALRDDLAGASMFVYISQSEGLGSAALLAMSMGIPVVASRVGGLPEVVEHGVTGLLVENNPSEIAEAMKKLASDRQLANRLGEAGRARAAAEFAAERLITRTLESYRRALGG